MAKRPSKTITKWLDSLWEEELICIYNSINSWKFPLPMKRFMPITYLVMKNNKNPLPCYNQFLDAIWRCPMGIPRRILFERHLSPINRYIEAKIGRKVILKYHNVVVLKSMTLIMFEQWWHEKHERNGPERHFCYYYRDDYIRKNGLTKYLPKEEKEFGS